MRIVLKYTNIIIFVCVLVKYLMRQVVYAIFKLEKMNQKYLFNLLRPTGHQQNETQGIITEEALYEEALGDTRVNIQENYGKFS